MDEIDQVWAAAGADDRERWKRADEREAYKIDEMRGRVLVAGKGLHRVDLAKLSEEIWLAELERDAAADLRRLVAEGGGAAEGPEFTNSVRNYAFGMISGWSDTAAFTNRSDRELLLRIAAIVAAVKSMTDL
jgi:hypothetical protein